MFADGVSYENGRVKMFHPQPIGFFVRDFVLWRWCCVAPVTRDGYN